MWTLVLSSILLPLITIALLGRKSRRPLSGWMTTFLLAAGVTGFAVLAAPWGFFGLPLRYLIVTLFVVAVIVSLTRDRAPGEETGMRMFVKALIGMFFGAVAFGVLGAHSVPKPVLDLGFPLTKGTYLVLHGGSRPAANIHLPHYAVDFVKLNDLGMRARGVSPADLKDYAIFGDLVVSPCDGAVTTAVDRFPDGTADSRNPLGNLVALRCGDATVFLAHLQRGSIAVRPGTAVRRGTPLARVGSSGLSPEPHLHVRADRAGKSLALTFERRWLVRNAVVRVP